MEEGKPIHFIECKKSGRKVNKALRYLKQRFPDVEATQIALEGTDEYIDKDGIVFHPAATFLSAFI